jgi:hypothetical protein
MGVIHRPSSLGDALTPICNACGVTLCWDIWEGEYEEAKFFWDNWLCQDCNGGEPMRRGRRS